MGIFDCLKKKNNNIDDFGSNLTAAFGILCYGDKKVMSEIKDCIGDTASYYKLHQGEFEDRDLEYSPGGERWLQLIAAVNAMEEAGYASELDYKEENNEFAASLSALLASNHIQFSLNNLNFAPEKSIPDWVAQFNEYAGQSGITVYSIDIDSDSYVLGAAKISDYAEAADIAGNGGVRISCRPQ